jgi:hypothetical protein
MDSPSAVIGTVGSDSLKITATETNIEIGVSELKNSYYGVIEKHMA